MNKNPKIPKFNPATEKANRRGLFVLAYLKTFNATKAAIEAGYTPKFANRMGWKVLKDPRTQRALAEFREARTREAVLSFDERAQILSEIARGKMGDFVTVHDNGLVGLRATEAHVNRAALSDLTQDQKNEDQGGGLVTKLRLRDPVPAIRELNEMYGDHAPKRIEGRLVGSIDSMTEAELDAEFARPVSYTHLTLPTKRIV